MPWLIRSDDSSRGGRAKDETNTFLGIDDGHQMQGAIRKPKPSVAWRGDQWASQYRHLSNRGTNGDFKGHNDSANKSSCLLQPLLTFMHSPDLRGRMLLRIQQAMRTWQCPFAQFDFTSDAHIACLGAHQHQDGGIIILGTGFCAGLVKQGQFREFGSRGLWLSDGASGAWIG